ncbi:MAG: nucleotidyltransferase family protein [Solirubrobacteraceae bacterium]|nr:nucleotidyltransferase family protein [Solirubrobacteraceae bacterium]
MPATPTSTAKHEPRATPGMPGVTGPHAALALTTKPPPVAAEELPIPTAAQLDLLRAALRPASEAAPAWRRWKARGIALEAVDGPSGRLFSQLWSNREAAGIGDDDLALLKGVYRQALASNAVTLERGFRMTQPLVDAGIPVVFTKGAAMVAVAGGRLGLRRMVDIDVLVPEAQASRAVRLLLDSGVSSFFPQLPALVGRRHAWHCIDDAGTQLDLHWWAFKTAGDDDAVFRTARQAELLGRSILIPSATELLLSIVANGFGGRPPAAPLRWIADATLLLETEADEIDWDLLLGRARRPGLTLALRDGLGFLADELGAPVPASVRAELDQRPVTWRERFAHHAALTDPRLGVTLAVEAELHRTRRLHSPAHVPRDLLGHLAQVTGAASGSRRRLLQEQGDRLVTRLRTGAPLLR